MHPFIRYWLPVILYCTLIFVQSSYPSPEQVPRFAFSDKLLHVIAYGILAALVCRAANTLDQCRRRWTLLFVIGIAAATLYGMSDEWHQSFNVDRSAELGDLVADFAGSVVGSWIYVRFLQMRWKASTPR